MKLVNYFKSLRPMTKMLIGVGTLFLFLAGFKGFQIAMAMAAGASFQPPPDAITTAITRQETWNDTLSVVGSVVPVKGVMVASEVEGKVARIGVESGSFVQAGDLLIEIDTSVEQAQLKSALAREELAQVNYDRFSRLLASKSVSRAEFDSAMSELKRAQADSNVIRARIAQKAIHAPFTGRVGIRAVNVGQYVAAGTDLMPLQTVDPVFVNFDVPQRYVSAVSVGQKLDITVDAFPDQTFVATVNAVNPMLNEATRNVMLQAIASNSDEKLRPGMFANVEVKLSQQETVIVIPATAVAYAPYGNSVFVVENLKDPNGKEYKGVTQHFVKLGKSRGDFVSVLEGLTPGQEVASTAVFKLRNGSAVNIDNSRNQAGSAKPQVSES